MFRTLSVAYASKNSAGQVAAAPLRTVMNSRRCIWHSLRSKLRGTPAP